MSKLFSLAAAAAIAAVALMAPIPALAQSHTINVCNDRSGAWEDRIVHVYATVTGRNDWGDDRLDGHILPGACRYISPGATGGNCDVDFMAEDGRGNKAVNTINTCTTGTWNLQ